MSIAQETIAVNNAYFTAMNARANAAVSCGQLQAIGTQVTASVNGTLSAITSELNEVNQQAVNLYNDIQNLAAHIATLTGTQTSLTQVSAAAATAAAVSDLGSVIAYCKLQGLSLASFGSTGLATFLAEAASLASQLLRIQHDYTLLTNKITSLQAQITQIPAQLTALKNTITTASSKFHGCTITLS